MITQKDYIKNTLRIFLHKTSATPDDDNVRIGEPTLFDKNIEHAFLFVTFTWDIKKAEKLKQIWESICPVEIGGPALNISRDNDEFTPGMFLKKGYVITSRGCPNKCWFCKAWQHPLKELKIKQGNNIADDNILACSENHIRKVFKMLETQSSVKFTGGLEAARLKDWHIDLLLKTKINAMFFAYDTPDDYEPLVYAGKLLQTAGYTRNKMYCYILIGYKGDTFNKAEKRIMDTWKAGFMPFSMLLKDRDGKQNKEWIKFQRMYTRPAIIKAIMK